MPCDVWNNHMGRGGMHWYSTDFSDFAYPWKAFCALWSNIWGADKNPSVASKQLQGLTLSKRGFYFPTVSTSCVYFIEPFSSHRGAQQPYGAENVFWGSLTQSVHAWNMSVLSQRHLWKSAKAMMKSSEIIVFDIQWAFHLIFSTATPHKRIREVNELFSQGPRQYVQAALSHVS